MSAPETNVKTQEKEHRVPLVGMILAVVIAIGLLIGMVIYLSSSGNEPGDDQPIGEEQGGTGAATATE